MRTARLVLLGLIGIAAIAVTFLLAPATPSAVSVQTTTRDNSVATAPSFESDIAGALSAAEINNSSAEGAPQQTVVNGWVARDLLSIIGRQLDAQNGLNAKSSQDLLTLSSAIDTASATQAKALNELITAPIDRRPTLLLLLAVLAIVVIGITTGRDNLAEQLATVLADRDRTPAVTTASWPNPDGQPQNPPVS